VLTYYAGLILRYRSLLAHAGPLSVIVLMSTSAANRSDLITLVEEPTFGLVDEFRPT
jgi:hypothetical protein